MSKTGEKIVRIAGSAEKYQGGFKIKFYSESPAVNEELFVPSEVYFSLSLYDRTEFSLNEFGSVVDACEKCAGKQYALKLLTTALYTKKEILSKLNLKGYSENVSEEICSEMVGLGYIDDNKYAGCYIRTKIRLGVVSRKKIFYELRGKGISDEIIEANLIESGFSEAEMISRALAKKFEGADFTDRKVRYKALRHLTGKGFSPEEVRDVLDTDI